MKNQSYHAQLQMILPNKSGGEPATSETLAIRQYKPSDLQAYLDLMHKAGFTTWDETYFNVHLPVVLEDGFFIAESAEGTLTATARAVCPASPLFPNSGELGWVAVHPQHRGLGLGEAVCKAVINRFKQTSLNTVYLLTDDFRLPAIKLYLKLGFQPFINTIEMQKRWIDVFDLLNIASPFMLQINDSECSVRHSHF